MIYLGADHGGFNLKEEIKGWLKEWGYEFTDCGAQTIDPNDDYPKYAFAVAGKVAKDELASQGQALEAKGILACRSAAGVVMAANKVRGVRAFAAFDEASARHGREHNDANVIALSGDWFTLRNTEGTSPEKAKAILKVFLETEFSHEDRHARRIQAITDYETSRKY